MIHKFSLLIILSLFLACIADHKSGIDKASAPVNFRTLKATNPYAGDWISVEYLNNIIRHQSPRKAQEGSEACFINLPETTLEPTAMAFNFHEEGPELVVVKDKDVYQLWEKQKDSLIKVIYTIESTSPDKITLGGKEFFKIGPFVPKNEPRILEEILFNGVYEMNKGERVEFKKNGEVTGIGRYKYYNPLIDYFDAGLQIDQVGLGETRDKMEYFGFKFNDNNLNLFELKCLSFDQKEKRCMEVDFGKKMFDLKKVKEK